MRLTLRTLLAYLDETLSPEDSQAIAEKLKDNEFALGLTHRIQSSIKRLRLGAPKLDGKGMGVDPNTVAEFLNDTLPPDRMAEFEKVCLESDVHLAEVAACHQIIALALSEAAEVPASVKQRMYALPSAPAAAWEARRPPAAEPAVPAANLAAAPAGEELPSARALERKPEIPDYLRAAQRGSWQPLLATAALLLLLVAIALLAMGSLDENHPVLGGLFRDAEVAQRPDEVALPEAEVEPAERAEPAPGPAASRSSEPPRSAGKSTAPAEATVAPATRPDDRGTADAAADSKPADRVAAADNDARPPVREEPATEVPEPGPGTPPLPAPPPVDTLPDRGAGGFTEPLASDPGADAVEEPAAGSPDVGRFIASDRDHVLATLDATTGSWFRLPTRAVLQAGQRLLVLPSYRPQLALSSGIHVVLVGPTLLELGSSTGTPALQIDWGRILMDTAGIAGSEVQLETDGLAGRLTFASADSAAAVAVEPLAALGQDPAASEPVKVCRIHVTTGQLVWAPEGQPPITVSSGQLLELEPGAAPRVFEAAVAPVWIDPRDVREIDVRASRELAGLLDLERPISLGLAEQIGHRQIEVSALAMEALGALEDFQPMVTALGSERHHAYWRSFFSSLQSAMRRSPQAAAAIQQALVQVRPEQSDTLYRLLYGYSQEQLDGGGAKELVELLESPVMEVRVLALENLRQITDRTHLYRPEREPIQQRKALQDWQTTLSKGLITYGKPE